MVRVSAVEFDKLTQEQQRVYKEVAGTRSAFGGPYTVWIRQPEIADVMNKVGDVLRVRGKLNKRLTELMVLIVAREWSCDYQWAVHEDPAVKAGLSRDVIDAIRCGHLPKFDRDDEQLIYDLIVELLKTKKLRQETYDRAIALLGEDLLIELVTNAGRYTQAAIVVNTFEVPTPGNRHPLTETKAYTKAES